MAGAFAAIAPAVAGMAANQVSQQGQGQGQAGMNQANGFAQSAAQAPPLAPPPDFAGMSDNAFEQHLFSQGMGTKGLDFDNMTPEEKKRLAEYLAASNNKAPPLPEQALSASQGKDMSQGMGLGSLMSMAKSGTSMPKTGLMG